MDLSSVRISHTASADADGEEQHMAGEEVERSDVEAFADRDGTGRHHHHAEARQRDRDAEQPRVEAAAMRIQSRGLWALP